MCNLLNRLTARVSDCLGSSIMPITPTLSSTLHSLLLPLPSPPYQSASVAMASPIPSVRNRVGPDSKPLSLSDLTGLYRGASSKPQGAVENKRKRFFIAWYLKTKTDELANGACCMISPSIDKAEPVSNARSWKHLPNKNIQRIDKRPDALSIFWNLNCSMKTGLKSTSPPKENPHPIAVLAPLEPLSPRKSIQPVRARKRK